jgi:hypothetical protein
MNRPLCTVFLAGLGDVRFSQILRNGRASVDVSIIPRKGDRQPLPPGDVSFIESAIAKAVERVDPALLSRATAVPAMEKALRESLGRGYQEGH